MIVFAFQCSYRMYISPAIRDVRALLPASFEGFCVNVAGNVEYNEPPVLLMPKVLARQKFHTLKNT